jgi:outer membrane protein
MICRAAVCARQFSVGVRWKFCFPIAMRNVLRIIFPTVLLMTFLSSSALAQQKIATVDMGKLFDGYWKTKQAETALNDRKAELDKEDRGFLDNLQKDREEYQKLLDAANDQAISADERDRRKQAATDKYTEIQNSQTTVVQFERQAQATLTEQTQRMRSNILKEIAAAVNTKAKAAGFTMVLDTAGQSINQTPIILYTDGQNDLTAAVLAQLNAGAPIDLNPPAATSVVPPLTISTNSP